MRGTPASKRLVATAAREAAPLTRGWIGLTAFAGIGLLLASELIDRLDRLEGAFGLGALNLIFALPVATIIVCTAALVGDWALAMTARRKGHPARAHLVTPLLALGGAIPAGGVLLAHLHHRLALDGWVAFAGSLLVILAAFAHHCLSDSVALKTRGDHQDGALARDPAPFSEHTPRRDEPQADPGPGWSSGSPPPTSS